MKAKYYLRGLGIGIIVTAIIMSFTRQPEKLTDAQIKLRALELGMVEKNVLADLQDEDELSFYEEYTMESNIQEDRLPLEENKENETKETSESDGSVGGDVEVISETAINEGEVIAGSNVEEGLESSDNSVTETEVLVNSEIEGETLAEGNYVNSEMLNLGSSESETKENSSVSNGIESNNLSIGNQDNISTNSPENEVVENYVMIYLESGYGSEYASKKVHEAGLVESSVELNQYLVRNGYDRKLRAGYHEIPVGATIEEIARIMCRME